MWDGVGGGREVQEGGGKQKKREEECVYLWLIYVDICQRLTQYYKVIILQLKINLNLKDLKNLAVMYKLINSKEFTAKCLCSSNRTP